MLRRLTLAAFAAFCLPGLALAAGPKWETDIAPLFKRQCVKCHGPAKQEGKLNLSTPAGVLRGGKDGTAVAPHDLAASLLWKKVSEGEMPPENPLPEKERELLKQWILVGAPGLAEAAKTSKGDATDHWAFRKLSDPHPGPLPRGDGEGSIDAFLNDQLVQHELKMNPPADRYTLLRRLSLDLLGLPPRADEIETFTRDASPDVYERAVDRLLASPRYGERWGKYWLDAGGYADSNGYFNADSDRPLAYRYRDYVIRAMNRDLPLDRFIKEQLAGDELAAWQPGNTATAETIELLDATHYLRNGQDGSGESDGNPDEVRLDRYTALESTMQNTASSLLGLTLQCAKCHDHKFEPITQQDYYRYQAIFYPVFNLEQWVKPNDRFVLAPLPGEKEAWERRGNELAAEITRLQTDLAAWTKQHRPRGAVLFEDDFGATAKLASQWSSTAPGDDVPGGAVPVNIESTVAPGAVIADGALRIIESGAVANRWLCTQQKFDWTPEQKGEAIQVTFDLVDTKLSEGKPAERIGFYIALHDFNDNSSTAGGNILIDGNPSGGTTVHVDYPGEDARAAGEITATSYTVGRNFGVRVTNIGDGKFKLEHVADGVAEEKTLTLAAADLPDGGFGFEYCCGRSFIVDNVRVENFPAETANAQSQLQEFAAQLKSQRAALDKAQKEREVHAKNQPGKISWVSDVSKSPPDVFLLERGSYGARKEKVPANPPAVLCDETNPYAESASGTTTGRRLAFANWLTAPGSRPAALVARVQANRLWQHHFGTGLVATPENLGVAGSPPSHPELLEHLAAELVRGEWSAKRLHRRILTSAAYRQSSQASEASLAKDADGRLVSRYPLRRLDAEAIRDSMLAASGDIDERMYGPYVPTTRDGAGEVIVPENQPGSRRRSIYLYQRRTQVLSMLATFDSPSIVFNSLSRPRSTMPLQSLSQLNSTFALQRAEHLASRLAAEHPGDDSARLSAAFVVTLGRPATESQLVTAKELLQSQKAAYEKEKHDGSLAWRDLCQMLLASNEFLYLE
ncbi:MAG: PSD1 domain-containing protein [Pirellulaceae bacterium]|nr:PSD1 domain-containing protein [Pirellulaceae bacterium]